MSLAADIRANGVDAVHRHDRVHDAVRRGEGVLLRLYRQAS